MPENFITSAIKQYIVDFEIINQQFSYGTSLIKDRASSLEIFKSDQYMKFSDAIRRRVSKENADDLASTAALHLKIAGVFFAAKTIRKLGFLYGLVAGGDMLIQYLSQRYKKVEAKNHGRMNQEIKPFSIIEALNKQFNKYMSSLEEVVENNSDKKEEIEIISEAKQGQEANASSNIKIKAALLQFKNGIVQACPAIGLLNHKNIPVHLGTAAVMYFTGNYIKNIAFWSFVGFGAVTAYSTGKLIYGAVRFRNADAQERVLSDSIIGTQFSTYSVIEAKKEL